MSSAASPLAVRYRCAREMANTTTLSHMNCGPSNKRPIYFALYRGCVMPMHGAYSRTTNKYVRWVIGNRLFYSLGCVQIYRNACVRKAGSAFTVDFSALVYRHIWYGLAYLCTYNIFVSGPKIGCSSSLFVQLKLKMFSPKSENVQLKMQYAYSCGVEKFLWFQF